MKKQSGRKGTKGKTSTRFGRNRTLRITTRPRPNKKRRQKRRA